MTPAQLVMFYREQAETAPGLALEAIDAALLESMSMERRAALASLRQEVVAVLDEAALLAWLAVNEIEERLWPLYEVRDSVMCFMGVPISG